MAEHYTPFAVHRFAKLRRFILVWADVCFIFEYIRLFVSFFLPTFEITSTRSKRRFTPYYSLPYLVQTFLIPESYIQPLPPLHPLIHAHIPPPRLVRALVCKHLFRVSNLSALANLPANLPRQLQPHSLHGQHARGPRPISTRSTSRQSLGAGSDEFALCPSVPHDG